MVEKRSRVGSDTLEVRDDKAYLVSISDDAGSLRCIHLLSSPQQIISVVGFYQTLSQSDCKLDVALANCTEQNAGEAAGKSRMTIQEVNECDLPDLRWGAVRQDVTMSTLSALSVVIAKTTSHIELSGNDEDGDDVSDGKTGVVTKTRPRTKKPSLYKVLLLNDDYTPMEFVIHVLEKYFNKGREDATRIMLQVHQKGVGVCGVYTYEVAETKVTQVIDFSRQHGHPLQCTMEKE